MNKSTSILSATSPLAPASETEILTSATAVIDALGGTGKVAQLLGVGMSSVSNYRRQGFPYRTHAQIAMLCEQRGITCTPSVLGGLTPSLPAHFHYVPKIGPGKILKQFVDAGFTPIIAPILQPATPFITQLGAEMRRRLYGFTTPDGEEICLRPELTIPTVLELTALPKNARYCYEGIAFRHQPRGSTKPEEFTQVGIEIFNSDRQPCEDEHEILSLVIDAIKTAKLRHYVLNINDVSLFASTLEALNIPRSWRRQLVRAQGKSYFEQILTRLCKPRARPVLLNISDSETKMKNIFPPKEYPNVIDWLQERRKDANRPPIDADTVEQIRIIANLECDSAELPKEIGKILPKLPAKLTRILMNYTERLSMLRTIVANDIPIRFVAHLGRHLAYYTGFTFELQAPRLESRASIAVGGRYDTLISKIRPDLNAHGSAIGGSLNAERVAEAAALS